MKGLAILRKKKNLTQTGLAKKFGVEMNTVWKWENSIAAPSVDVIQRLAEFFGVSVDELLNGPGEDSFKVTIEFVKTLEGVNKEMNMNGIALTIADDGFVGVCGGKKFDNQDDIEAVVAEVRRKLTFGFEHKDELKEAGK
jgi:transcriptional regulator with XRE-family HTH domain